MSKKNKNNEDTIDAVGSIDLTPTWASLMPLLWETAAKGVQGSQDELMRLARAVDEGPDKVWGVDKAKPRDRHEEKPHEVITRITRVDDEWRVRLVIDRIPQPDADYYTDDKDDAITTSKVMVERAQDQWCAVPHEHKVEIALRTAMIEWDAADDGWAAGAGLAAERVVRSMYARHIADTRAGAGGHEAAYEHEMQVHDSAEHIRCIRAAGIGLVELHSDPAMADNVLRINGAASYWTRQMRDHCRQFHIGPGKTGKLSSK